MISPHLKTASAVPTGCVYRDIFNGITFAPNFYNLANTNLPKKGSTLPTKSKLSEMIDMKWANSDQGSSLTSVFKTMPPYPATLIHQSEMKNQGI